MERTIKIHFKVTPEQKEIIESRMSENGFDDISAYLKVVALQTQNFTLRSTDESTQEASIELGFEVNESQKIKITAKMEANKCKDLTSYLVYVAQHAAITSVVEIRSSGNLDSMLERIAASRNR